MMVHPPAVIHSGMSRSSCRRRCVDPPRQPVVEGHEHQRRVDAVEEALAEAEDEARRADPAEAREHQLPDAQHRIRRQRQVPEDAEREGDRAEEPERQADQGEVEGSHRLCLPSWSVETGGWKRRRRRAFETTETELVAMAAAARIGLSSQPKKGNRTPAATGIRAVLYAYAQKRFCLMFRIVAFESAMAVTTPRRSPDISVMSAASIATSVPVPSARPMSAWARAGASLMPSPTIPTRLPSSWSRLTSLALSPGRTSARTRSIPTSRAIASAVRRLSPVIMMTSRPSRCSAATAAAELGLRVSATATSPAARPPTPPPGRDHGRYPFPLARRLT